MSKVAPVGVVVVGIRLGMAAQVAQAERRALAAAVVEVHSAGRPVEPAGLAATAALSS
jgi:hypothetical protein